MNENGKQINWFDNHALFESELKKGHGFQRLVGLKLQNSGIDVEVSPIEPVKWTRNKEYNYPHDKDIVIADDFVIEVKSRNLWFDRPYTFPFETTIVDTVSGWDQKVPEPRAVVIVSQLTECMLVLNVQESKGHWEKERIYDSVRDITCNTYLCPKRFFRPFDELVDWLKLNY